MKASILVVAIAVGLLLPLLVLGKSKIIKNPIDQNIGKWGEWDDCPEKTYASGFQLKVQLFQNANDDTFMNGIRLICSSIGQNNFNSKMPSSLVGNKGDWGGVIYCDRGTMIGFQFRSEPNQGEAGDDTAGNNIMALCAHASGRLVWRDGDGATAGRYTGEQLCRRGQAIRSIRTQVDMNTTGDLHGLVNVEMRCDDVPIPEKCVPESRYDLVVECNNINGESVLDCRYSTKEGVAKTTVLTEEMRLERSALQTIGISVEASYGVVEAQVSQDKTWSSSFSEANLELSSEFWTSETARTVSLSIRTKSIARVYQLTSSCGVFQVGSPEFIISTRTGDLPNPFPASGFVCKEPKGIKKQRAAVQKIRYPRLPKSRIERFPIKLENV